MARVLPESFEKYVLSVKRDRLNPNHGAITTTAATVRLGCVPNSESKVEASEYEGERHQKDDDQQPRPPGQRRQATQRTQGNGLGGILLDHATA